LGDGRAVEAEEEIAEALDAEGAAEAVVGVVIIDIAAGLDAGTDLVFCLHPGEGVDEVKGILIDALIGIDAIAEAEGAGDDDLGDIGEIGGVEAGHADGGERNFIFLDDSAEEAGEAHAGFVD